MRLTVRLPRNMTALRRRVIGRVLRAGDPKLDREGAYAALGGGSSAFDLDAETPPLREPGGTFGRPRAFG